MRTGQSRHKPLWLNYAQRLWGPTGRRHSWNRNEGHGLVKPPLIVYCEWLSSAPLLLLVWAGHAHCWNPCVGRVSPVVEITSCLGLLTFACGCFQPDDILHMFERSWVVCMCERSLFFPPPVPSLFWCAFWLFSPRPDRPAAPCHPDSDGQAQERLSWHVSQSSALWMASKLDSITQNVALVSETYNHNINIKGLVQISWSWGCMRYLSAVSGWYNHRLEKRKGEPSV